MNAKEIVTEAVKCDRAGRILQAQFLYQEGIKVLCSMSTDENDLLENETLGEIITQYLERVEELKRRVQTQLTGVEVEKHISIEENSTGHSYNALFGCYLNENVWEVLLEEPYLTEPYHFQNLVNFLELLIKKCANLKYIRVVTKPRKKNDVKQLANFEEITSEANSRGVTINVVLEGALHDRKITLNTCGRGSFIIKIGRGLHFYKPAKKTFSLGLFDYDFRKCLQTDVDILRTGY